MLSLRQVAAVSSLAVSSSALAQDAVQWRVEDGGNGHWYQGTSVEPPVNWLTAKVLAHDRGGYLATVTSTEEFLWIASVSRNAPSLWVGTRGPFLGGQQAPGSTTTTSGWSWLTGEPWFAVWGTSNCGADNFDGADVLTLGRCNSNAGDSYNDWPSGLSSPDIKGYVIEWSSDCNSDGIVDFGQIISGELADTNSNGVPDCCESLAGCNPCPADVDSSGSVNGVDLAAVLNTWGSDGGKYPGADVNGDGIVDGADLAEVLNGWGPCP